MLTNFSTYLTEINYPSRPQKVKEAWDIEGRLKNSNQIFKFDVRPMKASNNRLEKQGYFKTKADKMVFETIDNWIIFDIEELHNYIKTKNIKDFNLEVLMKDLDWNIILPK